MTEARRSCTAGTRRPPAWEAGSPIQISGYLPMTSSVSPTKLLSRRAGADLPDGRRLAPLDALVSRHGQPVAGADPMRFHGPTAPRRRACYGAILSPTAEAPPAGVTRIVRSMAATSRWVDRMLRGRSCPATGCSAPDRYPPPRMCPESWLRYLPRPSPSSTTSRLAASLLDLPAELWGLWSRMASPCCATRRGDPASLER